MTVTEHKTLVPQWAPCRCVRVAGLPLAAVSRRETPPHKKHVSNSPTKEPAMKRDSDDYALYRVPGRRKISPTDETSTGKAGSTPLEAVNDLVIDAAALAPIPDGFPPDLIVLSSWKENDLEFTAVLIPDWYADDFVHVMFDGVEAFRRQITQEEYDDGELVITIPAPRADGEHTITYSISSQYTDDVTDASNPLTYIVDTRPPGTAELARLELPDGVEKEGLDDAKLAELGGVLECTIKSYSDYEEGDVITVYVVNDDTGNIDQAEARIPVGGKDAPTIVTFTREQLVGLGAGKLIFTYDAVDLAGNRSGRSTPVDTDSYVGEGIEELLAPIVPANTDNGFIDEAEARAPVEVGIPRQDVIEDGDEIVVIWGTQRGEPYPVTNAGGTNDPMEFVPVPYAIVQASAPNEGDNDVDVSYEVRRGGRGRGTSPATPVKVNLDQPGGIDPEPETPVNEALGLPIVRHGEWTEDDPENVIPVDNSQQDATFIVPWNIEQGPGAGNPAFIVDDVIRLYYGDDAFTDADPWPLAFHEHVVTAADVTAAEDLEFVLPADKITEHGSGEIPVMYTGARHIQDANGPLPEIINVAYSRTQLVTVESAGELPGGGDPLPYPLFKRNIGYTNSSPPPPDGKGVGYEEAFVQPYVNMEAGDLLRIHVRALFLADGSGGAIKKAAFGHDGDTLIPDYPYEKYVSLSDVGNEVPIRYPWERIQYLLPVTQVYLSVTVTNAAGKSVTSGESDVVGDTRANPSWPPDPDRPPSGTPTVGGAAGASSTLRPGMVRVPSPWSNGKPKKGAKKAR
ncbi:hypothetical protein [Pandoraea pneumonica]|uniref:hypothetical protein n=1 Tax=Pandoraea pneumonica TaxID=2508299 RepID=UPI003CFB4132